MADEGMKVVIGADVSQGVAGINQFNKALQQVKPGAAQATQAMTNLGRVVSDAPFGFIAISNNIDPLLQSFRSLRAETGSAGGAIKALVSSLAGGGGLALGVTVITSLLVTFGDKLFSAKKKTEELADAEKKAADDRKAVISGVADEAAKVTTLVAILQSENTTRKHKKEAIAELQKLNSDYFGQLKLEGDTVKGLNLAYIDYIASLVKAARAKAVQTQIQDLFSKRIDLELKELEERNRMEDEFIKLAGRKPKVGEIRTFDLTNNSTKRQMDEIDKQIQKLLARASEVGFEGLTKDLPKATEKIKKDVDHISHAHIIDPEEIKKAQELHDIINGILPQKKTAVSPTGGIFPSIVFTPAVQSIIDGGAQMKKALVDVGDVINKQLGLMAEDMAVGIGEALGDLLSGGFKNGLASFMNLIGAALQSIGKAVIHAAAAFIVLKKVMSSIIAHPEAALAVGIAMVALGAVIKNSIPKFAEGGVVTKPTLGLFGEAGPEAVIPLSKMGGMFGSSVNVQGEFRIRGRDLVAVVATGERSLNRIT